jgi:integrase
MSRVRARPNGRLFFDFRFRGERCRELSTLTDTPANRKKMERALAKIESDIADGFFDYGRTFPGSKMAVRFASRKGGAPAPAMALDTDAVGLASTLPLFAAFSETWKLEKQVEWRIGYRHAVESILETHLLPEFGERHLDGIDRPAVLRFRSALVNQRNGATACEKSGNKPLAPATINRIVGILRMIMEEGATRFHFENPCLRIKRLKLQRKDIDPFTLYEVQKILGRVRTDYRQYLTVRIFTGVRSGEVHGLKWKHVDFERREILIRETFRDGRIEYTKTDGSQREIHMSQPVFDALVSMRPADYAKDPKSCDDRYVFCTRNGNPIDNTNFNDRVWKPLLRNLGFKYRRPYEMRHTCATLWLAAGESPEWIARQLGHTTTEMLFRTYSRYVPNLVRRDGRAFDTLVAGVVNGGIQAADDESEVLPKPFLQVGT